jgi:hypothetical protein
MQTLALPLSEAHARYSLEWNRRRDSVGHLWGALGAVDRTVKTRAEYIPPGWTRILAAADSNTKTGLYLSQSS